MHCDVIKIFLFNKLILSYTLGTLAIEEVAASSNQVPNPYSTATNYQAYETVLHSSRGENFVWLR